MISAIILAAGTSSRMGRPKPLLRLEGRPLLEHALDLVRGSGIEQVIVVLGYEAERMRNEIELADATVVVNPNFTAGMSTSIQTGLRALDPRSDAFLVVLVDQPFVSPTTLEALIDSRRRSEAKILLPTYRGVRGNPVLLDSSLSDAIYTIKGDQGYSSIFDDHKDVILEVPVDDPGILLDLDTEEQLQRVLRAMEREEPLASVVAEITSTADHLLVQGRGYCSDTAPGKRVGVLGLAEGLCSQNGPFVHSSGEVSELGFVRVLGQMVEGRRPFSVATVVRIAGSSLGKPGFKMIINSEDQIVYGTLGGACPEGPIVEVAHEVMETAEPRLIKVFLDDVKSAVEATVTSRDRDEIHVETNCGGVMEIYVEPYLPQERLIIVGAGGRDPVEDSLVHLGKLMGFEVLVIDHKPVLSNRPDVLIDDVDFDLSRLRFSDRDSVVLLTRGERDVGYLAAISKAKVRYVGLMASRHRISEDLKGLQKKGVSEAFLKALHAPIGLDIGAESPSELALSIMAEIVAIRHGRQLPRKGEGA